MGDTAIAVNTAAAPSIDASFVEATSNRMDISRGRQGRAWANLGDSEADPFEFFDMDDAGHDDLQWEESLCPAPVSPSASRQE
eukprot:7915009-Pyramimonas_sp.AAC.1